MSENGAERDHIYVGRTPGMTKWSADFDLVCEWAGGEENVSIMHKRGREYVLDLSTEHPFECSMNRSYDCGHVAYGPPRPLPDSCPECKPVATDGGNSSSGTERTYRCRVYGEKTVKINAESPDEAQRKATSQTDTGELEPWVEGEPEPEEFDRTQNTGSDRSQTENSTRTEGGEQA